MHTVTHTASILLWLLAPLSIFDTVAGWFEHPITTAVDAVKAAWGAVQTVWEFLVKVSNGEWNAWDWLVNGTEWLGKNLEDWAGDVYSVIGHALTSVIPDAAKWALSQATKWAASEIDKLTKWVTNEYHSVTKWAASELSKLEHLIEARVKAVLHFVTGPIEWVIHTAYHAVELVLHPELLAKYLVEHIALPLVRWLLKETGALSILIFKAFESLAPEILIMLEDVIDKVV